ETGRPAVLVAVDEKGVGKGSGRSIPAFDLHAALAACREHLVRFGGHRSAAGITIDRARLGDFTRAFNDAAMARLTREDLVPELRVDVEIPLADASEELEAMLRHFEPFGIGNATPMLVSRGVRVASRPRTLKGEGLRVSLEQDGARLEALGWGLAGLAPLLAEGAMVDVAYRLERDDYKGEQTLQARLADIVVRR
ncbi:MAG: single-stranded-DNA-specific exonuclease RecJ, partial [Gemmatimonadaceae bacterium]|nr:single-stranded-DNA-specific exonuclease RecJ [Gemmatimonadaceae bacterium]